MGRAAPIQTNLQIIRQEEDFESENFGSVPLEIRPEDDMGNEEPQVY